MYSFDLFKIAHSPYSISASANEKWALTYFISQAFLKCSLDPVRHESPPIYVCYVFRRHRTPNKEKSWLQIAAHQESSQHTIADSPEYDQIALQAHQEILHLARHVGLHTIDIM